LSDNSVFHEIAIKGIEPVKDAVVSEALWRIGICPASYSHFPFRYGDMMWKIGRPSPRCAAPLVQALRTFGQNETALTSVEQCGMLIRLAYLASLE
jgi:hypothetical protein